jgi:hypothetical protein
MSKQASTEGDPCWPAEGTANTKGLANITHHTSPLSPLTSSRSLLQKAVKHFFSPFTSSSSHPSSWRSRVVVVVIITYGRGMITITIHNNKKEIAQLSG